MKNYTLLFLSTFLLIFSACKKDDDDVTPNNPVIDTELSQNKTATDASGNVYNIGFDQATSINQNPYIEKKDANGNVVWRKSYETTAVDGRGVLITLDANGKVWATFTVDGGSNDDGFINKKHVKEGAFAGVYANSYGSGGGPKASIIARIDPESGDIEKGTFMTARLTDGKTNTLNITKIGFKNGNFAFEISSAAWPPAKGKSYARFPDITDEDRVDGAFKIYYEINTELSEITEAVLLKQ